MAGIYNGHLLEFPQIRVDCFTSPSPSRPHLLPTSSTNLNAPWVKAPNARLYLLTHVHTDHLTGLSNSFTGHIICSPDTKRMLLRLEAEIERERLDDGTREQRMLKYDGLRRRTVGEGKLQRVIDTIEAVPYGDAREYELGYENGEPYKVSITLLDANHCPGSTMFLIRSKDKAVLHTGDVRADTSLLNSLRSNPSLGEYVEPASSSAFPSALDGWGKKTLDRIYLDTSAVLGTGDMPDRDEVLAELVEQMSMYPIDTVFFLNAWCFGWEHVVKAVARHFRSPVHVDRYKRSIYAAVESDPFLLACTTTDPQSTRFHACERRFKCPECKTFDKTGKRAWNAGRRVVHVNMVEVKAATWDIQQMAFRDRLGRAACGEGEWPFNIECPIARHSPLPELQALVKLFRPLSASPNCVVPTLGGLDYFLLPSFLKDLLNAGGYETMLAERDAWFTSPNCFIRSGPDCLAVLKKQQQMGLDILAMSTGIGVEHKYDDYLPGAMSTNNAASDGQAILGLGRRQIGSDQAMRAAGIMRHATSVAARSAKPLSKGSDLGHAFQAAAVKPPPQADIANVKHEPEADLSDTDNEEHQQKRRRTSNGRKRRRRLVSPSTARNRVLESQKRHLDQSASPDPAIKTEAAATRNRQGQDLEDHSPTSDHTNLDLKLYSDEPEANATQTRDLTEKPQAPKCQTRYRVDSQHLAALMGVGATPPSSP